MHRAPHNYELPQFAICTTLRVQAVCNWGRGILGHHQNDPHKWLLRNKYFAKHLQKHFQPTP